MCASFILLVLIFLGYRIKWRARMNFKINGIHSQGYFFMMEEGKTERVARSILSKVEKIYKKHPAMTNTIRMLQRDLENSMLRLKEELKGLDKEDANMVTVSIINDIHRKVDEIFLADFEPES